MILKKIDTVYSEYYFLAQPCFLPFTPKMDVFTYGTINFSPSPYATTLCLILEESDLRNADYRQIERFWRVWYKDRAEYAPHLKDFTLILQPKLCDDNTIETVGITKFMQYFRDKIVPYSSSYPIKIMMDQFSEEFCGVRHQITQSYETLFETPMPRA